MHKAGTTFRPANLETEVPRLEGDEVKFIRAIKVSQVITTSTTTKLLLGAPAISEAEEGTKTQTITPIGSGRMRRGEMSVTRLHLVGEQCRLLQCLSQLPQQVVQQLHPIDHGRVLV